MNPMYSYIGGGEEYKKYCKLQALLSYKMTKSIIVK